MLHHLNFLVNKTFDMTLRCLRMSVSRFAMQHFINRDTGGLPEWVDIVFLHGNNTHRTITS